MEELLEAPLAAMAEAVRSRSVKSVDLVRGFLDRIEKVNPELNAVVCSTADLALKYAAKYDAELASTTSVLRPPIVKRRFAHTVSTAEVCDNNTGFSFLQNHKNLALRISELLRAGSPSHHHIGKLYF